MVAHSWYYNKVLQAKQFKQLKRFASQYGRQKGKIGGLMPSEETLRTRICLCLSFFLLLTASNVPWLVDIAPLSPCPLHKMVSLHASTSQVPCLIRSQRVPASATDSYQGHSAPGHCRGVQCTVCFEPRV